MRTVLVRFPVTCSPFPIPNPQSPDIWRNKIRDTIPYENKRSRSNNSFSNFWCALLPIIPILLGSSVNFKVLHELSQFRNWHRRNGYIHRHIEAGGSQFCADKSVVIIRNKPMSLVNENEPCIQTALSLNFIIPLFNSSTLIYLLIHVTFYFMYSAFHIEKFIEP